MDQERLIKKTILELLPDSKIMLFGSRARQTYTTESDYDILIIINQDLTPSEKMPLRTIIRKSLLKLGILSDIIIQSHNEISIKKNLPGHIIKTILHEGVIL